jgi:hypothetical protein
LQTPSGDETVTTFTKNMIKNPIVLDNSFYTVKRSSAGLGLFAVKDIRRGEWIVEYVGILRKNEDVVDDTTKYLFDLNDKMTLDGSPRYNTARYANHACKECANARWQIINDRVYIRAITDIKVGEEITYDYGKEYFDAYIQPHGCKCKACEIFSH